MILDIDKCKYYNTGNIGDRGNEGRGNRFKKQGNKNRNMDIIGLSKEARKNVW